MTKVYIVQAHNNKDMSDARRTGNYTFCIPVIYSDLMTQIT